MIIILTFLRNLIKVLQHYFSASDIQKLQILKNATEANSMPEIRQKHLSLPGESNKNSYVLFYFIKSSINITIIQNLLIISLCLRLSLQSEVQHHETSLYDNVLKVLKQCLVIIIVYILLVLISV